MSLAIELMERRLAPDALVRAGIRRLLRQRLRDESVRYAAAIAAGRDADDDLRRRLCAGPIAVHSDDANRQHYELPPAFFEQIMGDHLKYSACYWPEGVATLTDAEAAMLTLTCERADLRDGQRVLELGCGWGSLSLWLAAHYPAARIDAVSNSTPQRRFIERRARERRLRNLRVITADINDFATDVRYDRVVSVEMFEHVRNHRELLRRIHGWLAPDGRLFVHVFSHRRYAYPFETAGDDNWMGRYFFTGGMMPSRHWLGQYREHFDTAAQWHLNGRHYQRTCEAWLDNQDRRCDTIMPVFDDTYGPTRSARWFQRWRVFFMACAELFGYAQGEEWGVSHYLFERR